MGPHLHLFKNVNSTLDTRNMKVLDMTANSLIYNSYLKPQLVWVTVWRVFELDTFVKCYLIAHTASNFIYSGKK